MTIHETYRSSRQATPEEKRKVGQIAVGGEAQPVKTGNFPEDALCVKEDPELFFPVGAGRFVEQQEQQAKAFCGRCPVEVECLVHALENDEQFGIWGGRTEQERRAIKRRQKRSNPK